MYKSTIGLEIHAELKTNSKMFCSCKNDPEEKRPNINICPVCAGHPGTLPVANEDAIKKVIKTGLALNCNIAEVSKFDRKNYFYPDLPKGYQISQYDQPLCSGGYLDISVVGDNSDTANSKFLISNSQTNSKFKIPNHKFKRVRIRRIHLEEDTGSLVHPDSDEYSLVNLNRAGVPLMELVTEPDIESGIEARKFAEELQLIFRYLGVSDADMEKGLMRVEVNISVSEGKTLGTKVEIKNLNSFKVVEKAINFEIERQREVLESGKKVIQETRGWNDKGGITFSQREKEEAYDYRYFPEPDLPPLHFKKDYIKNIKSEILELPKQRIRRFSKEYGLNEKFSEILVRNISLGNYYEKTVTNLKQWLSLEKIKVDKDIFRLTANYLVSDVLGILKNIEFSEKEFKVTPENFAEFIKMIKKGEISSKIAKMVLAEMIKTGYDPSNILDFNNWRQMSDSGELEKVVKEVISKNQKAVEDYKKGNKNALQFLAGQVMAATRGTANPEKVSQLLEKLLR